jgi:putative Holliday junction resolvase
MAKIAALDLGDQWVGIALSDSTRIIAKPYTTVTLQEFDAKLKQLFEDEDIGTVVVGYPRTMHGAESAQTIKIKEHFNVLKEQWPQKKWIQWDERLSSQRASSLQKGFSREEKIKSHARAAAFILDSYLLHCSMHSE